MAERALAPAPMAPGSVIRFCIGVGDGRRSDVWRIWGSTTGGDTYVAHRPTIADFKMALHTSGVSMFGLTSEGADRYGIPGEERTVVRWQGVRAAVPDCKQPATIVFPLVELTNQEVAGIDQAVQAPPSSSHEAVSVEIWIQEQGASAVEMTDSYAIGSIAMPDGRCCHVVARAIDLPPELGTHVESAKSHAKNALGAERSVGERLLVFGKDDQTATHILAEVGL